MAVFSVCLFLDKQDTNNGQEKEREKRKRREMESDGQLRDFSVQSSRDSPWIDEVKSQVCYHMTASEATG